MKFKTFFFLRKFLRYGSQARQSLTETLFPGMSLHCVKLKLYETECHKWLNYIRCYFKLWHVNESSVNSVGTGMRSGGIYLPGLCDARKPWALSWGSGSTDNLLFSHAGSPGFSSQHAPSHSSALQHPQGARGGREATRRGRDVFQSPEAWGFTLTWRGVLACFYWGFN